jgi:predicted transcriptional regulator
MDRGSVERAVRERITAASDRWFTVNSLAGELESSDQVDADRQEITVAVERALSDLVAAGVVERDGSTYRSSDSGRDR